MEECHIGDFVMFRRNTDSWNTDNPYRYGMIKDIANKRWTGDYSTKTRYNILCTTGKLEHEVREDRIIILSKGKIKK